jgi:hypothetical protein
MSAFVDRHVYLEDRAAMLGALDELVGEHAEKFRGSVSVWPEGDASGPAKWSIEINDWNGNTTTAQLGDHLVLTYGRLLKLTDAEYLALEV